MIEILVVILLSLSPFFELRAAIPYGILIGISWPIVFVVSVISNILLAPLLYLFFDKALHWFLRIEHLQRMYDRVIGRVRSKVQKALDKWGVLGLTLFIGLPVPGSGVYTGVIGAYLLGFKFKDVLKSSIYGVLIAGTIVLLITLFGVGMFNFFF